MDAKILTRDEFFNRLGKRHLKLLYPEHNLELKDNHYYFEIPNECIFMYFPAKKCIMIPEDLTFSDKEDIHMVVDDWILIQLSSEPENYILNHYKRTDAFYYNIENGLPEGIWCLKNNEYTFNFTFSVKTVSYSRRQDDKIQYICFPEKDNIHIPESVINEKETFLKLILDEKRKRGQI